jgi:predicted Rossmann fold flavoprotein
LSDGADVAIVGAGAAGLATAIFTARLTPGRKIVLLDGAQSIGAKILVSGGGRCNVTNRSVTAADFWRPASPFVRRVLRSFSVEQTVAFFAECGVRLREEERGKLFPETGKARSVLSGLLAELARLGVELRAGCRVLGIERAPAGFAIRTSQAPLLAHRVVLATGGLSLPKTGSDGAGYGFATSLGHSLVPTTPALAPLLLDHGLAPSGQHLDFHARLSGLSHEAELRVAVTGQKPARIRGPLLWTHFGISGPAALDASRFWHRAQVSGETSRVSLSLLPGEEFAAVESRLLTMASARPAQRLTTALAALLPAALGEAVAAQLAMPAEVTLGRLQREDRRRLVAALLDWPLSVSGSRGYAFAEVTAGGVPLEELDPATLQSRRVPGLHCVGEIIDVDGRIGGFNFQWAWSTAHVAARALAAATAS